ncbi:MAG TPA: sigma-54 dependent transcriptional regulator [Acetobacteraceae bacterium]|nr:sigma-54 dependent transcriptional regulator [Acetobacteraceae bacterium]
MVGGSPGMRQVFEMIRRFALCDAPVLVTGETGTGKELVAKAIHERSSRRAGPFIAINCAALPANLIASELFGYEKGAFTGASARKLGLIETAHKGTLFLDEIGDLPAELQGHLLRFLQEGLIVRLGGRETISVDVRIIAATNVRLAEAISAGRFRDDLFYRLNVLTLTMPPLREREGDIELMARFFLRMAAKELDRDVTGFDEGALAALRAHPWPGNVRELISAIRRAVVMGSTPLISAADLALTAPSPPSPPSRKSRPQPQDELQMLLDALARNGYNKTRTAQELGIARLTIYRILRRHNLPTLPSMN